jgi:hypothetical protein
MLFLNELALMDDCLGREIDLRDYPFIFASAVRASALGKGIG